MPVSLNVRVLFLLLLQLLLSNTSNGLITIAIRVRFECDSSTIRARVEHSMLQHATRFFVRSHTSPIRAPYEYRVEACHTVD